MAAREERLLDLLAAALSVAAAWGLSGVLFAAAEATPLELSGRIIATTLIAVALCGLSAFAGDRRRLLAYYAALAALGALEALEAHRELAASALAACAVAWAALYATSNRGRRLLARLRGRVALASVRRLARREQLRG